MILKGSAAHESIEPHRAILMERILMIWDEIDDLAAVLLAMTIMRHRP